MKNVSIYLAGNSDAAKMDTSGNPFTALLENYKMEFKDVPKVIEWINLCGDCPEQSDTFIKESSQGNTNDIQQDLLTLPIEKIVTLVSNIYRILSVIVLTSARGKAMAWAATNLNYIPVADKRALEQFTVIGDGYDSNESVNISTDSNGIQDVSWQQKYDELNQRSDSLNEELAECQWTIASLKDQLKSEKEEKGKCVDTIKDLEERLERQEKKQTGQELYKKGRFEVAILENVIQQLMIREKERNVFKSM